MSPNTFPRGRTAIVAGATYGIGEAPGYNSLDLATLASLRALDMAGCSPRMSTAYSSFCRATHFPTSRWRNTSASIRK
jgi:hypothetical protein